MNLQQIGRVAVCAAIVALCVAGSGLYQAQPVAGQETKPASLHGAAALDQLKRDGLYDSLQTAMNEARFSVSRAERTPLGRAAWRAPNPAAGYDAYVTEEGVSIAVNDETYVSLSLHGIGYGEALQAVGPGEVYADKQTINLRRYSGLREWYVNGPDGLEQGFTLSEPQGARQSGAPLRLALQVSAGWRAVADEDGKLVTLRGPHDEAVEYGKLVARDSLGRNIPARLTVADERVVIEAEDGEAAYPLTIDPLFVLQQKLTAADGAANDCLGYAVALDGDTALVGAPYDDVNGMEQGSAYVFVRSGSTWTQKARLTAPDGASFDYFGWSVALKGSVALVGAIYGPGSSNPDQGAVYVFVGSGSTWTQQARLNANESTVGAQFGAAVALDGDTVIVGAPIYTLTPSFTEIGVVYIFVRNGSAWTQQARLNANDGENGDHFGMAVALEGDTALIGAPNNTVTAGGQGAAYVFTRNGASWTQRQRLLASNAEANDHFGNAVALGGETALISAYLRSADDQGAVYVFERRATGWTETNPIVAPDNSAGAHFGVSVALDGNTAVIGASLGLFQPGVDQRSAYVFVRNGKHWGQVRRFGPELGSANDAFGYAVALDGDTVLVGAYRSDAVANNQGAAYAFALRDSRSVERQKLTAADGVAGAQFGHSVALDGDTLAVGALYDASGANGSQGSVYVFARSGATWTLQQKLTANDGADGDQFGHAVALSGDTLVVGANGDDVGGNGNQGSAYVFTRNGVVWTQRQKLTAVGIDGLAGDNFGASVSLSGQTVAVGAPGVNNSQGSAYVFRFNGSVWTQQAKLSANDGAAGDFFGYALALDGDTLAVGAEDDNIGANAGQGSVYVFTRNGAVWTQQIKLTASDGGLNDRFGGAVALSGDTLAVGAIFNTVGANVRQGSVYVFTRSGATWVETQKLTASDGAAEGRFGYSVALRGGALVVGAQYDNIGASSQQGSAYVFTYYGRRYQQQKLTASDGATRDNFGHAVAIDGDTLAISAVGDDIGANANQGSVYVFVNPPCPAFTFGPDSLPNGARGAAYSQQFIVSNDEDAELHIAVSKGALPPGLTLNDNSGLLSGAPDATGTYHFTITVTFVLRGCSASRDYTLTITPPCPTIAVNPVGLPAATQGKAYSQTLTATGGATPYSFAVAAGALPQGLSLSAGGLLSGAPTQTGSYSFTARATDANGCAATRAYTLIVSGSVAHASAASYDTGALAPDSIVVAFGSNLATEPRAAQSLPLPIELAGSTVTVRDSQGGVKPAPLFYVSPNQINYLMPSGLANGAATVTIKNGQGVEFQSPIQISAVAPGLFSANAYGTGPASALALRVRADGQQVYEPVARYDAQTQSFVLEPIDLSNGAEQVYLVLFGTGVRHRGALADVTVEAGETQLPVAYAGASPELAGVDQVNVFLPASLRGRGEQTVVLSVNGKASNGVNVRFQ